MELYEARPMAGRRTYRLAGRRKGNGYQLVAESPGVEVSGVSNLGTAFAVPDPIASRGCSRSWIWSSALD